MKSLEGVLRGADSWQQRHRLPGFIVGVVKKFGDDRGGQLAALITYYGFAALFPLLLLLVTLLGYVLRDNPSLQSRVLGSALADFPVIGDQLRGNVHSLTGSTLAVVIGCLGLLYGSLGIAQTLQFTMAQVWNIPGVRRPGYLPRLVRSVGLIAVLGLGLIVSSVGTGLVTDLTPGPAATIGTLIVSVLLNCALYLACFRILTPKQVPWRWLLRGCLAAGPLWTLLQAFGGLLVAHQLRHANQVYGLFGTVLGLLSWIYLGAQLTVYAAESNVVHHRHLWPRALLQPPLTQADRRVLDDIAEQEERRPEQHVESHFHDDDPTPPPAHGRDDP
ncbi:YihY/virulence factor BrkB family protein [Streptomyces sp. ICBB 8177]|uniref:YihY/virulence factor BrkB family protein n=1 Tax=Streptomyces sp. ICBB 8177 TaxID=563922 RepID=UPI000D6842E1|nr:YihY/virulence factor BrkB family protein [Streptomyces sp. ICBB 8177]PWI44977.1 ribonuclease [Streptomyces sp. ICBB 8177]